MERVKLLKKVRKKRAQFLASEPEMHVTFLDDTITESSTLNPISDEKGEYHFFIGNGGTRNGISREVLTVLLGKVDSIYMPESKDFSFATVTGKRDVRRLLKNCNGICVQDTCKIRGLCHLISPALLKGPPLHLYLSLVDCIPTSYEKVSDALEFPPGLFLFPEFISEVEERQLLNYFSPSTSGQCTLSTGLTSPQDSITKACPVSISPYHLTPGTYPTSLGSCTTDQSSIRDSVTKSCLVKEKPTENDCASSPNLPPTPYHAASSSQPTPSPVVSTLKHRRVSHYGYEFLYGSNRVDPEQPLPGGLPAVCTPLLERMREQGLLEWLPDQLTANDYLPGAGIPPHVDTHSPFEDKIVSLSLGSQVVMDLRHPDGRKVAVFLQRRSLLIMTGESRYLWSHGITPRKLDEVHGSLVGYGAAPSVGFSPTSSAATVIPRGRRVSLTFRKVKRTPCTCRYPSMCDSQSDK